MGRPPGHPRGIHENPGGMVQFWYFFFPRGWGVLFSFGNDFAGSWGHTHGICSKQCDRQGEKCFTLYHGRCVKMSTKPAKKIRYICSLFLPMKSKYYTLVWQWRRLFCYSWQLVKAVMLWVFILPPREGLFVINFMPFTQGLWMVFVCHEKQLPGGVPGVDPRGSKW